VPADLGNSSIVVSAGGFHTCALLSNFSANGSVVRCFGLASDGQIAVPSDLTNPVAVSAGFSHTCAVTSSGGVRCWGSNRSGQASPPPGLANVAAVSAGDAHTCALLASGVARCFGRTDSGQTVVPTGLPGPVTAVSAGFGTHTCIRTG
jgi:alpha-tubulin suppressor-like RCC1 family protein